MRRAWLLLCLLLVAGCATRSVHQVEVEMREWPQWIPAPVALIDSLEFYPVAYSLPTGMPGFLAGGTRAGVAFAPPPPSPSPIPAPTAKKPESQPVPDPTVVEYAEVNKNVTLVASADGTPPFSVFWKKDGLPLAGATRARLELKQVSGKDAGVYVCIVTNEAGVQLSPPVRLVVRTP
jgi:hypothetical protein